MGISLFIRKGASKTNVNLSCRVSYRREAINLTTATKLSVNRLDWENSHKSKEALKRWFATDEGKYINDTEGEIAKRINNYVLTLQGRDTEQIKRIIADVITPNHGDLPTTLCGFAEYVIAQMESGKIRINKGKNIGQTLSPKLITTYRNLLATLRQYESDKGLLIGWGDVNAAFISDFKNWMVDKGYKHNTSAIWHGNLRRIIQRAANLKLVAFDFTSDEMKTISRKETETIALTQEQVDVLYNGDFGRLNRARDIFIVGCETAQRWSDYSRLSADDIVTLSDGIQRFKIEQAKTHKTVYPPVTKRAKEILDRYDGALPKMNNSALNHDLKKICRMAGGTFLEMQDQHSANGKVMKVPTWKIVGTHTARRTGATLMYRAGVPIAAIMAITGHSSEKVLQAYLRLSDEEKAMDAIKFDYWKVKMA